MTDTLTVSVLGGGSFGTAIANIIAANGHTTFLWMRDATRAARAQSERENSDYLPGYSLNQHLTVTADLSLCTTQSDIVVLSVPSKSFRAVARLAAPHIQPNSIVLSTTKGIEGESFLLMSQVLEQELGDARIGVLSGPNFAKEIIAGHYTGCVVASDHSEVCSLIQRVFSSQTFRIYHNADRFGVELGGTLKNIYAIITGMAVALGCGQNTTAMLLTRSLAEMGRFARELGANSVTFLGLAGVGDLILTCTSNLSRNYRVGFAIGKGKTLEEAMAEIGQTVEGVNTLKIVKQKADELNVYMPLVQALHEILFERQDIMAAVQGLMTGEMTSDVDLQGGV